MNKPIIQKEEGKLKWLCNEAFYGVKRILPESIRESEKYDKFLAFSFGFISGDLVASIGEYLINIANNYGADFNLEKITTGCLIGTVAAPVISYLIAPKYVNNFIRENPRYSSGTAGVMTGAALKALKVLL